MAVSLGHGVAKAGVGWVDVGTVQERDAFGGRFEARASGSWNGVTVLDGWTDAYERCEGYFPRHVLAVNRGKMVPFEASLPGRTWYSSSARPGQVNVWPAKMPHSIRWLRHGNWCVVQIDPAFVATVATSLGIGRSPELRSSLAVSDPVAAHLATALALESREGGAAGRLIGESLGTALVGHLLHAHSSAAGAHRGSDRAGRAAALGRDRLRRVLECIDACLDSDLSLRDLADVAGMDVFRFVRAFKAATGHPPHYYVVQARIDRAKVLLHDPERSISDVARRTGFASASHFSATFRRITGSTPRSWRSTAP